MKENLICRLSFEFALCAIELYKLLTKNHEYVISRQFLKSATSIGANVEEAIAAYSKKEFISKMSIASKEARESKYWIRLLEKSQIMAYNYHLILEKIDSIINILTKIVKTAMNNIQKTK